MKMLHFILGIRGKLIVLFSLVLAFVACLIYLFVPERRASSLTKAELRNARALAVVASSVLSPGVVLGTYKKIQDQVHTISSGKQIEYLVVTDTNNSVVASYNISAAVNAGFNFREDYASLNDKICQAREPIVASGITLGYVYIGLSLNAVQNEVDAVRRSITYISVLLFLLGVLAASLIASFVTRPLREIVKAAQEIEHGNHTARSFVALDDELGHLSRVFNSMVDTLNNTQEELEELNGRLEEKVRERTSELSMEVTRHKITEETLLNSEQQLLRQQRVFSGGPAIVFQFDVADSWKIISASENLRYAGKLFSGIGVGDYLVNSIHPEDRVWFTTEMNKMFPAGKAIEKYFKMTADSGEIRWMFAYLLPSPDKKKVDGYVLDVTDGKLAEERKEEAERRYRAIYEQGIIGVVLFNPSGKIIDANQSFLSLTGYKLEEIKGTSLSTYYDLSDGSLPSFLIFNNSMPSLKNERRLITKSGKALWMKTKTAVISDSSQAPKFGIALIEDISKRVQSEEKLRHETTLLQCAADALTELLNKPVLNDGIAAAVKILGTGMKADRVYLNRISHLPVATRTERVHEWVSDKCLALIEHPQFGKIEYHDALPQWFQSLMYHVSVNLVPSALPEPERSFLSAQNITSFIAQPIIVHGRFWGFLAADSCSEGYEWQQSEIKVLNSIAGSIGAAIERDLARGELITARKNAVEIADLKDQILHNLSHEMMTPLNGMSGNIEIILEETQEAGTAKYVKHLYSSYIRLKRTVEHMMIYSQYKANRLTPNNMDINIIPTLNKICNTFLHIANSKGIEFVRDVDAAPILAYVDPLVFQNALSLLLDNAFKFTVHGSVTVIAELRHNDRAAEAVISIVDTGIGIEQKHFEMIFEEFKQVSRGKGRMFEGNGIGLPLAMGLAKSMKGAITVSSTLGQGSVFELHVPASLVQAPSIRVQTHDLSVLKNKRILVVEDHITNRQVIEYFLRDICTAHFCSSGEEAEICAIAGDFDIFLIDINLGFGKDGISTLEKIRSYERYAQVPAIAVTGYISLEARDTILRSGFTLHLSKPVHRADLYDALLKIFGTKVVTGA